MTRFIVDVEYSTHDALKAGVTALGFRRFAIFAADADEATLTAASWVSADRITTGVIATSTLVHV